MKTYNLEEWRKFATDVFGTDNPRKWVFSCLMCHHAQSVESILKNNPLFKEVDVMNWMFMSCEGRYTDAGVDAFKMDKKDADAGKYAEFGCNWTFGGLFQFHQIEVIGVDGKAVPVFDFVYPKKK